ncbi:type VI secretion system baseplate subunit TssG [Photobacterium sp. 53610]|uniref:type VI secretion system baseplate subunit TssG n=1 Tax=Photobacterium sp. 53610 TaxID=3102789 RepID=UPI002ED961F9
MIDKIQQASHEFAFFQAVYLLEANARKQEPAQFKSAGLAKTQSEEFLRFRISPELGFPRADIAQFETVQWSHREVPSLTVNFGGLHGTGSPLPTAYTEKLAGRDGEDNPVKDFFDFFHHRYLSHLYRIWKKYRYHVRYESGAVDPLSRNLFNLVGISSELSDESDFHFDRAKLLSYIGQLSSRTRSPNLVSGVVAHCFNLKKVSIEQWVPRRVKIAPSQLNSLGHVNCVLGRDYHLGDHLIDITGKFNLVFHDLSFEEYCHFLPGEQGNILLKELMRFVLRDPMAWDLKMEVMNDDLPASVLGAQGANRLGQVSWLGNVQGDKQTVVVIGAV